MYGLYCASFTHAGGDLHLNQLDNQDLSAGSRTKLIRPGGGVNPAAHILSTANPRASYRTCDLLTVLTAFNGAHHLYCSGGHVMRYQARQEGGTFLTTSSHFVQSTAKGFLHLTEIAVDIDSDEGAYATLEYVPISSDGGSPITNTPSQSLLSAPVPTFNSCYFMGGSWLGSTQITGLKRFRFSPGTTFVTQRSDGGVFPRRGYIHARTPVFSFDYLNVGLPYDLGSFFHSALGAAIKAYLQRGTTNTDGRIAGATSSHVRFQADAGSWGPDNIRVAGTDDGMLSVRVMPTGSVVPTLGVALGA